MPQGWRDTDAMRTMQGGALLRPVSCLSLCLSLFVSLCFSLSLRTSGVLIGMAVQHVSTARMGGPQVGLCGTKMNDYLIVFDCFSFVRGLPHVVSIMSEIRIGINGFGRIGRLVTRAAFANNKVCSVRVPCSSGGVFAGEEVCAGAHRRRGATRWRVSLWTIFMPVRGDLASCSSLACHVPVDTPRAHSMASHIAFLCHRERGRRSCFVPRRVAHSLWQVQIVAINVSRAVLSRAPASHRRTRKRQLSVFCTFSHCSFLAQEPFMKLGMRVTVAECVCATMVALTCSSQRRLSTCSTMTRCALVTLRKFGMRNSH